MQKVRNEFFSAIPSSILIIENYEFQATVSDILKLKKIKYSGVIEINIPYYSWRRYREQMLSRKLNIWKPNIERLNYLQKDVVKLSGYGKTNLDSITFLSLNDNFLPLSSVLLQHSPSYSSNESNPICSICFPYLPTQDPFELFLEIKIFDEKEVEDHKKQYVESQYMDDPHKQIELTKQVAQQISKQVGFEDRLVIEINLSMLLPYKLKEEDALPNLSGAKVVWPISVSQRRIKLKIDEHKRAIIYNPQLRTVEWGGVRFEYLGFDSITQQSRFELPLIKLEVMEPGEFFLAKRLEGELSIDFPFLLSGVEAKIQGNLHKASPKVTNKSKVVIKFTSLVEKLFERKVFSPYQHLQFPNVLLTEMRVADIVILLKDMYFSVTNDPIPMRHEEYDNDREIDLPSRLTKYRQFLIEATKQDSGGELKLWILVEGLPSGTTREKEIPGREKFITNLPTGSTTIYIRGQLAGDSKRVVNVINEIHKKLKERFRHVSTLE